MENITIQYPPYFLLFCLLAGILYAGGLYLREDTFRRQHPGWHRVMASLRFLSVTILSFLLMEPLVRTLLTDVRKPVVVLAQDQSESVGATMDQATLTEYRRRWEELDAVLSDDFDVRRYSFGERVREGVDFVFRDKASNLSELVRMAADQFSNQPLGALVVASDGVYNQGLHPLYVSTRPNAPVFTIGLGDTSLHKDLVLKRVFHNQVAYMGDRFTIQADIAARNCAGQDIRLQVSEVAGGVRRLLQTLSVPVDRDEFFRTREIVLEADAPGVRQYELSLMPVDGEKTASNNGRTIFVDVIDARQKILLLANSPHPDISALRQTLEKNRNYQVTTALVGTGIDDPGNFDLVILHNLPGMRHDISALLEVLNKRRVPRMFIVGTQTDLARFNQAQPLLTIIGDQRNTNDVQGVFHPDFNLFNIGEETRKSLPAFNPLTAPFGDFQAGGNAQVLLLQRIGKVDTRYPLLLFGETDGVKTAVLAAEGLWRWRLFDYLQHQDHSVFEALIGSNVQYTTLKADKRRFRMAVSRAVFNENEPVVVDAELYNQGFELVNDPDVFLVIRNSEGKEFNFTFSRTTQAYTLAAGTFPPGDYTCSAKTTYGGEVLASEGKFSIQPLQLEIYETTANHGLLRKWSEDTGGAFFRSDQLDRVGETLLAAGLKPTVYTSSRTRSVIHLKWIFWTLVLLLTAEWFLRRYLGGY